MAAAREWSQPLRGNKFLGFEGGVRVSCAVWWENGNARGGRKIDELNTWSQSGTIAMLRMGRYKLVYDILDTANRMTWKRTRQKSKYAKIRETMLKELLKWEIATEGPLPVPRNR